MLTHKQLSKIWGVPIDRSYLITLTEQPDTNLFAEQIWCLIKSFQVVSTLYF